jgi:hypothetical protein
MLELDTDYQTNLVYTCVKVEPTNHTEQIKYVSKTKWYHGGTEHHANGNSIRFVPMLLLVLWNGMKIQWVEVKEIWATKKQGH